MWARVCVLRKRTRRDALGEQLAKNPRISQDIPGYPRVVHYIPGYPGISSDIASKPHETAVHAVGSGLETQKYRKTNPFRKSGSIPPTLLLTHSKTLFQHLLGHHARSRSRNDGAVVLRRWNAVNVKLGCWCRSFVCVQDLHTLFRTCLQCSFSPRWRLPRDNTVCSQG